MINTTDAQHLLERHGVVIASDGSKIGKIGQIYLDDQSGNPEWVTVSTGLFGSSESFVPLADATVNGDDIAVPFTKDKVKDAPRIDADGSLSPADEDELYRFYGLASQNGRLSTDDGHTDDSRPADHDSTPGQQASTRGQRRDRAEEAGTVGHDTSGPTTDNAMTRSEEELRVGTTSTESGRARLRKFIVSEQVTETVPVSHEEVTLEREPITEATRDDALAGAELSEEEHEVVLHAEEVEVDKTVVPKERVKLGTETVTEEQTVTEEVRKEKIDTEAPGEGRTSPTDRR